MKIINSFSGEYRFLSNFYPSPMIVAGRSYPTVEHLFQSMKTTDPSWIERIRLASSAGEAKRLGRRAPLQEDWEVIKDDIMLVCLRYKFVPGSYLGARLVETGDAHLEEGNTWGDRYWGTVNGKGQNRLGELLIRRREELRNAAAQG